MDNSYKTAITRKRLSAPTLYLLNQGLIQGKVLDYGCGKGFDGEALGAKLYDPHFFPNKPRGQFDTILCNYVLNVVDKSTEEEILLKIKKLLKKWGKAFITVRRDIITEGTTSKGTYQRNVILDLPLVKETKGYAIYLLTHKRSNQE